MGGKKRKHVEPDIDVAALLNTLGGGKADIPSMGHSLGNDPDTKLYTRDSHIYFQDEINFDTASALIKVINETATELKFMQKQFDLDEPPSIKLHITSPGGIVFSAYSIIDCMEACEVPIHTYVDGYAASCGTIISIHGDKRFIGKNACMLCHQVSSGMWSTMTFEEQQDHHSNIKQMAEKIRNLYAAKTNMTKPQLKELLKHDIEWDAEECLRRGLVDEIV
jgi:ATP-dependent protease ClpP protease subunit